MLLTFPFSNVDAKLAVSLAKYLELVGPYKSHDLLIVTPTECENYANEVLEAAGDQFAKTSVHFLKNHRDGWPGGANRMFFAAMMHVWREVPCECWYFFEPDNTPVKPNWINTLYDEYRRVQRPFLGVINPTHFRRKDETFFQEGTHLVGTAIYPKETPRYSKLYKTIPLADRPFDVYWQWEITKHAAGTILLQHEWRSWKYSRDKNTGEIIGERHPSGKLPYAVKPLMPDTVVHHGCKDGSLMAVMREVIEQRGKPFEMEASV